MTTRVSTTSGQSLGAADFPESEGKYSSDLSKACLPVALSVEKIFAGSVGEHFLGFDRDLLYGSPRSRQAIYNFELLGDLESSSDENEIEASSLKKCKTVSQASDASGEESDDLEPLLESLGTCTLHARGSSAATVRGVFESVLPLALKGPECGPAAHNKDPCKALRPQAPKLLAPAPPFFDLPPHSSPSPMSEHSSPPASLQTVVPRGIPPDSSILLTMNGLEPVSEEPDNSPMFEASSASRPLDDVSRGNLRPLRAKRPPSESEAAPELQVPVLAAPRLQRRKLEERPFPQASLEERCFATPRTGKKKKHPISISKSPAFQRCNRRKVIIRVL